MKNNYLKKHSFLTKFLVLLLTTSTACSPLGRSRGSASHVKDDEDPDGDEREDQRREIDEKISEELREIRQMTEVTTDPDLDSTPYLYMEKNLDVETVDDNDGFKSEGNGADKSLHAAGAPTSSSPEEDDKVNWRGRDEITNMLRDMDTRIKYFKNANAGNGSAGDEARGRYNPGAPDDSSPSDMPYKKTPQDSKDRKRLDEAWKYRKVASKSFDTSSKTYPQKQQMVDAADYSIKSADESFANGDRGAAEFDLALANKLLNVVVSTTPEGWAKTAYVAFTGRDSSTNAPVSANMQAASLVITSEAISAEVLAAAGVTVQAVVGVGLIVLAVNSVSTIINDIKGIADDVTQITTMMSERNPAQDRKLSEAEGKRIGAEDIKRDVLGPGKNARADLYVDRDGNIYVKPKGGAGPGEPTGLNLKDFDR